jgi:hypothetical protein
MPMMAMASPAFSVAVFSLPCGCTAVAGGGSTTASALLACSPYLRRNASPCSLRKYSVSFCSVG